MHQLPRVLNLSGGTKYEDEREKIRSRKGVILFLSISQMLTINNPYYFNTRGGYGSPVAS